MSRFHELMTQLCPSGVRFVRLGDVARIRNGRDYKHLGEGKVPVYGSGGVMTSVNVALYTKPSVLIPRKGSLDKLYYVNVPFWTVDTIFYTEIRDHLVPKFLYYFLATQHLEQLNQAGGVPSLTQSMLNEIKIPVPPLEVQREIVRILDHFTALEAELEAELAAERERRQQQYAYYRDLLLTFHQPGVERVAMGEVLSMRAGQFISASDISPAQDSAHTYPCFGGNGLRGYVSHYNHEGAYVLIGRQGALSGNVKRFRGRFYATEHAVVATVGPELLVDWAFHMLTKMNLNQYVSKGAQPGLAVSKLNALLIPIPPIGEQRRVASILDTFDALVNDLSSGLPAELNARRQQYAYYRDRLLTFKELAP